MTRPYPHQPDVTFQARHRARRARGIQLVARTIGEGRADEGIYASGVDHCLEAAVLAWLFEEPQAVVEGYLEQGVRFAGQAHEALTGTVDWGSLFRWLQVALLADDAAAVDRLAQAALAHGAPEPEAATAVAQPLLPLAATLTVQEDAAAARLAADLRRRMDLPDASAVELRRVHGLPDIADAILARDQAALDAACTDRSARNARYWARSVENRRHWHGLLDPEASLLAATAPRYGLLPPDVPDLPRGLMPGPHRHPTG